MKQILLAILALASFGFQASEAQELTVATFNIRYQSASDSVEGNGWERRRPVICDLVRFHNFEVFGAQEALHNQLLDLLDCLPGYGFVGVGRDDGKTKGEYSPILYQQDKFKVIEDGTFWLSEITDRPNKGWDAAFPRICTWAKLQDLETGLEFYFFNLHMDHVGVEARKNGTKLVLEKITEMCDGEPVILVGDFNIDQHSPDYALLHESEALDDAYEVAKIRYALNGTFNGFNPDRKTESRIDHVFVSPFFTVERYGILTDAYVTEATEAESSESSPGQVALKKYEVRTPSDHFPVKAVVSFKR